MRSRLYAVVCLLAAGAAVALGAGCGGSSGSGEAGSGASATSASTSPTTRSSSLKVIHTPKYGTPSKSAPVQGGSVQIAYRNIAIAPDTLRVKVGTRITWTNYDSVEHNVTSEGGPQSFASKNFGEAGTFQIVASRPGVIHYQCTIHPASMNGTIEVVR